MRRESGECSFCLPSEPLRHRDFFVDLIHYRGSLVLSLAVARFLMLEGLSGGPHNPYRISVRPIVPLLSTNNAYIRVSNISQSNKLEDLPRPLRWRGYDVTCCDTMSRRSSAPSPPSKSNGVGRMVDERGWRGAYLEGNVWRIYRICSELV